MAFRHKMAVVATAAALAFSSPYAVYAEGPKKENIDKDKAIDPFQSKKLPPLVAGISGSDSEKAQKLFDLFKVGNGILKQDSGGTDKSGKDKRLPRTVDETLEKGGDCTEFAFVVLSSAELLEMKSGALLVHLDVAQEDVDHIVAYVSVGDEKILIDPQAAKLGVIGDGKSYKTIADLSFEEAKGMYYREMGNYYHSQKKTDKAIESFKKSLEFNGKDAYVYHQLGVIYEKKGDVKNALACHKKAYELNPQNKTYEKNAKIAEFNYEIAAGLDDYNAGNYKEAKAHFEKAIEAGKGAVSDADLKTAKDYSKACD